jgi:hypothetical protein
MSELAQFPMPDAAILMVFSFTLSSYLPENNFLARRPMFRLFQQLFPSKKLNITKKHETCNSFIN